MRTLSSSRPTASPSSIAPADRVLPVVPPLWVYGVATLLLALAALACGRGALLAALAR